MDYSESQEKRGIYGRYEHCIGFPIGSYGRATPSYYLTFFTYWLPDRRRAHLSCTALGDSLASPNYFRRYPLYIR